MITGILDVSHWEYDRLGGRLAPALQQAKAAGIVAVIAKATQGKDYVDPSWPKWARAITDAGLLLGAYHFGSNTSAGDQQADWFLAALAAAQIDPARTLLALDFENNPKPADTMGLCSARVFLHRTHARTARRPMLYGSNLLQSFNDPHDVVGEFPLWIAAYGPSVPNVPRAWRKWTLFQYTDGPNGPADQTTWPRRTPGFGMIDRSAYAGTAAQLRDVWQGLVIL
jgi:lysozyme